MIKPFAKFRKLSKNITDYSFQFNPQDFIERVNLFPELITLFNHFPSVHLYLQSEGGLFYGDLILEKDGKTKSLNASGLSLEKVLRKISFKTRAIFF